MSNFTGDWAQFDQQNLSSQAVIPSPSAGDQIQGSFATTVTSDTTPSPLGSSPSGPSAIRLSSEGRVSKPARRRSRASRRTPTTLLNTDSANFRAMVQQFTGGPTSAPFAAPNFSFGIGSARQQAAAHVNSSAIMVAPAGGYHHLQSLQSHQQQHRPYMFSLSNNNNHSDHHNRAFLQRIGTNPNAEAVSDGSRQMDEGVSSQLATSSNENGSNRFMF